MLIQCELIDYVIKTAYSERARVSEAEYARALPVFNQKKTWLGHFAQLKAIQAIICVTIRLWSLQSVNLAFFISSL